MKIKYSPCKHDHDTVIEVENSNAIFIDGEFFEFDPLDVSWPGIKQQTNKNILAADRINGELYLTVRRFYSDSCSDWDTGAFHEA